jgi:hypothetical protein
MNIRLIFRVKIRSGNMKTTKEQRNNLRELLSNASQGKWAIGKCLDGIYADKMCLVKADRGEVVGVRQVGRRQCQEVEYNANFIVEAHNILSDLLDDLDELSQQR